MTTAYPYPVYHWPARPHPSAMDRLIAEEPLAIRIDDKPYAVVMRTPGDELAHAAGLALAEGIIDNPTDMASLAMCDAPHANTVTVTLTPDRRKKIADIFDRRGFISQTKCGISGRQIVKNIRQAVAPLADQVVLDPAAALRRLQSLSELQPLRAETRAAHAAALMTADWRLLAAAEDVGRHNALDKAVGKLFLKNRLEQAAVLLLSSRISYELVQKAGRSRIPVILAVSRPTALAVALAEDLNITLACGLRPQGLAVFTAPQRFQL